MKLWQKIFLCTFLLVMAVVDLTAVLLVGNSHKLLVQREKDYAVSQQENLINSLKNELVFKRWREGRDLLGDVQIKEAVVQLLEDWSLEEGAAVFHAGAAVASANMKLNEDKKAFADALGESDAIRLQIVEQGDQYTLLTASTFVLENERFLFLTEGNVTRIYELRRSQFRFAIGMSIACSAAVSIVLLLMLHFLLKPLNRVNRTVDLIARGNYEERFTESGSCEFQALSENLNRMTIAIQLNIDKLEDAAEARKMFIANLAHEMKTPLTSILGFADVLRVKKSVGESERREYTNVIVEETKRLRALSSKLMELITMGSSVLDFQAADLFEVMRGAAKTLEPVYASRGIQLRCVPVHHRAHIDRELFESLLYNLLENAAKASHPGGSVAFFCRAYEGRAAIVVEDQGIGMTPEEVKNMFEPFYMADKSRSRKSGGAGLGLALCQEIAAAHNAQIFVSSRPGEGTAVTVALEERWETGR